jgi:hypothetical protein
VEGRHPDHGRTAADDLDHGLADTMPPQSSMEFLKLAQAANIPPELHAQRVPHAFINQRIVG